MRNKFSFIMKFSICAILLLGTTGCWNSRELNNTAIVMGIGLDKAAGGGIQLTAQIVKPEEIRFPSKQGGTSTGKAYWNASSTGDTVSQAVAGFNFKSGRKLFFPHNQVIVFNRDVAAEGIRKYVDYFARDHETRLTTWLLVSEDATGAILDIKPELEKLPAREIANLVKAQYVTAQSAIVNLEQFMTRLMSKTSAPVLPVIKLTGEGEEKSAIISGTAVFRKDKLIGRLDRNETRGLLWVTGEVKGGIIVVGYPDSNTKVSLEVIRASSKITTEIKDNKIHFKVVVKEEGNVSELNFEKNTDLTLLTPMLEKKQAEAINSEITTAIKKARELDADIFGFGDIVHKKYPELWGSMESRWDEIFQNIEVELAIETKLHHAGRILGIVSSEKE